MKDLKVTLYEILGYGLPGSIFFLATSLLFWTLILPSKPIPIRQGTTELYSIMLVILYFSGHVVQSIGNLFNKVFKVTEESVAEKLQLEMPHLMEKIYLDIAAKLQLPKDKIALNEALKIAEETLIQVGNPSEREIFQYREGFYRGLYVSCILLTISLILRLLVDKACVEIAGKVEVITMPMTLFFIALSVIGSFSFYKRFIRFLKHRVKHTLVSYLVLTHIKKMEG